MNLVMLQLSMNVLMAWNCQYYSINVLNQDLFLYFWIHIRHKVTSDQKYTGSVHIMKNLDWVIGSRVGSLNVPSPLSVLLVVFLRFIWRQPSLQNNFCGKIFHVVKNICDAFSPKIFHSFENPWWWNLSNEYKFPLLILLSSYNQFIPPPTSCRKLF